MEGLGSCPTPLIETWPIASHHAPLVPFLPPPTFSVRFSSHAWRVLIGTPLPLPVPTHPLVFSCSKFCSAFPTLIHSLGFMGTSGPAAQGPAFGLMLCYTDMKLFIIFEQGTSNFYFALGPINSVTTPAFVIPRFLSLALRNVTIWLAPLSND